MTTTLTSTEAALLTTEMTRIENALTTLNSGALADYLLTHMPALGAIDAIDTTDDQGPFLYITATYGTDGSDISDELDPESVMDHLGNHGVTAEIATAWHGRVNLLEAVAAARALLPRDATCRHCAQGITPDPDNDWIHLESGGVVCGRPVNHGDDDTFTAEPASA